MKNCIKRRIYPTDEQELYLSKCFGHTRWYWNYLVNCGKSKTGCKGYAELKRTGCEWLSEIPAVALSNTRVNYQRALDNHRRGSGSPKFHSKHGKQSFTISCQGEPWLRGDNLYLPKRRWAIKICKSIDPIGDLKFITISKAASGKYYASFLFDCETPAPLPFTQNTIGIDVGVETFCTTSNGEKICMPSMRKKEVKIIKEQKRLARKINGSNNYNKQRIRLARANESVVNARKDFHHKLSKRITDENQVIVIEDLAVKNMLKNHKLARSIARQGWRQFADMLKYKSERKGRTLIKIDRFYPSSQICSGCGSRGIKKPLNIRKWKCPDCGASHDRDINAAINILTAGTAGLAC